MSLTRIKYLEELAHKLGFTLSGAEDYVGEQFGDVLTLYSEDVEVFIGSIQDLERWFQGFQFAHTPMRTAPSELAPVVSPLGVSINQ